MLSKYLGQQKVHNIFVFLYAVIAFGLPFNKVILSLATLLLALITILDFDKATYLKALKSSKIIQLFILLLGIHLISLFWSSDYSYFFKDLNTKLPFYVLPFVFLFHPIQKERDLKLILGVFLASITFFSLINFISYYGWRKKPYDDIRSLALFISHIRFGLMLVFGCVICVFWMIQKNAKQKWIAMILILWFLTYTYFSEVLSAYISFVVVFVVGLAIYFIHSKYKKMMLGVTVLIVGCLFFSAYYFYHSYRELHQIPSLNELPRYTKEKNKYEHLLNNKHFINGHHVYSNICSKELLREWQKVSKVQLFEKNKMGYETYYILIQYMASKGLKKDAEDFQKLSKKDIIKIEQGIANYKDQEEGVINKVYAFLSELELSDPNGKTFLQRFEYWKASCEIVKRNPLLGVGAGDLELEFNNFYNNTQSKLKPEFRLRAHNQYITYFVSFGVVGGILFLYFVYYVLRKFIRQNNFIAALFWLIILCSFISEDTIETQMGATFVSFFLGLFLFKSKEEFQI